MRVKLLLTLVIVVIVGCKTVTGPSTPDAGSNFRIVLDQRSYTRDGANPIEITATVTNTSTISDFYANVGDAFNEALEQSAILAARGTHAVIERRSSDYEWENANVGQLFEGSRFVVLRAGKSYLLAGYIAPVPGTYRIRLAYSTVNNDPSETLPLHDYSATFRVR